MILCTVLRYSSTRDKMVAGGSEGDTSGDGCSNRSPNKGQLNVPLQTLAKTTANHNNGYNSTKCGVILTKNQSKSSSDTQTKLLTTGSQSKSGKRFTSRSTSSKSVLRMTKMLVIVSSSFLLLNLPSHSIRVYYFFVSLMNKYHLITHRLQSCLKLFRYENVLFSFSKKNLPSTGKE